LNKRVIETEAYIQRDLCKSQYTGCGKFLVLSYSINIYVTWYSVGFSVVKHGWNTADVNVNTTF